MNVGATSERTPRKRQAFIEQAYELIKRDIVSCELEPGQHVSEQQLANRYSIGRAGVRAALKRLYQEQFVQSANNNRYVITPITLKYVEDLFDLRLILEPLAARRAAGIVDGESLTRLNDLARASYRIGDHASAAGFLAINTEFHVAIARAAGNALLADAIANILDKAERINHMSHLLNDRNEEAHHEHRDLVAALITGDGELAERVMREQIRADRRFVVESMVFSPSVQFVNIAR